MAVPYTFGSATSSIPLSQLDSNFATAITLGNTAVYLGNTTTTLNALTLSNVTISSGNVTITSVTLTNANITGTTTLSGLTASTALALDASKNIVSVTNTGTGNNVLAASPSLTGTVTIATLNLTNALGTTYGGTGLTSFTANGVVYASSSSALATGSALTFDGTNLKNSQSTASPVGLKLNNDSASTSAGARLTFQYNSGDTGYVGNQFDGTDFNNQYAANRFHIWLNSGSEQMRLTSTGLGIGTSSPAAKLNVNGTALFNGTTKVTGQAVEIQGDVALGNYSGYSTSNFREIVYSASTASFGNQPVANIRFQTTSDIGAAITFLTRSSAGDYAERLRLDQIGNLGLGVTPNTWYSTFKAFQFGANGSSIFGRSENNMAAIGSNVYVNAAGSNTYINTNTASYYQQLNGQHQWYNAPSGTAGNAITFTQAMTLGSNGFLGIGQTSPAYPLDISTGANAAQIAFQSTISSGTNFKIAQGIQGVTNSGMQIYDLTNSAVRLAIDNSGNLRVGTTSTLISASEKVSIDGGALNTLSIKTTGGTTTWDILAWNSATSGNNNFIEFGTETSYTARGSIVYNRAGGVVLYNTTSDYRAKDISGFVSDSGALIDSVPVYMGKMKGATQERPMFIAHETPAYAHTGEKDAVDEHGNPVYQQMDASALIPVMWAEIQSLRKRLADAGI
jgi:hypothetical protein